MRCILSNKYYSLLGFKTLTMPTEIIIGVSAYSDLMGTLKILIWMNLGFRNQNCAEKIHKAGNYLYGLDKSVLV